MHIGKKIMRIRKRKKLSQKELGRGIVSDSHLCNIEAGRFTPSDDLMRSFAIRLGFPENFLLKSSELDESLEALLTDYRYAIVANLDSAKEIRSQIKKDYPFIYSIEQEVFFNLCESSFFLKTNEEKKAYQIYVDEVRPYLDGLNIDHDLPDKLKELYFYFHGGWNFAHSCYAESIYCYQKQLPFVESALIKTSTLYNLAYGFHKIDHTETAIYYGEKALNEHLKRNEWKEVAETYNLLGIFHTEYRTFSSANDCLTKALDIADLHHFSKLKGMIFHNFGVLNKKTGRLQESERCFFKAIKLKESTAALDIPFTYRSLIDLYIQMDRYQEAYDLLTKALQICVSSKQLHQLKLLEAQINLYFGDEILYEQKMKEAIHYLYDLGEWKSLKHEITDLANYLYRKKRYKIASNYYKLQIEVKEKLDRGDYHEEGYTNLGISITDIGHSDSSNG